MDSLSSRRGEAAALDSMALTRPGGHGDGGQRGGLGGDGDGTRGQGGDGSERAGRGRSANIASSIASNNTISKDTPWMQK